MAMPWVLVVDDDQATCESLRMLLEGEGYAVAEAPDGQYALDMLRSTPYHVVVLFDVLMPILDGIQFIKTVCADPEMKVRHGYILMTANVGTTSALTEDERACLTAIVRKPFEVDDLLGLIRQAASHLPHDA